MINVEIDGKLVETEPGSTVMDAANKAGSEEGAAANPFASAALWAWNVMGSQAGAAAEAATGPWLSGREELLLLQEMGGVFAAWQAYAMERLLDSGWARLEEVRGVLGVEGFLDHW